MDTDRLPIGRRVAYWRGRRNLSQQMFADRLGKSKSWVDKVERGVRALDRVSTLQDIAAVLRIDTAVLLGRDTRPASVAERAEGVERIRTALSTYDIALGRSAARQAVPPVNQVAGGIAHAWTAYRHARYPQLAAMLPDLLGHAQRSHAHDPEAGRTPLVEAYRVTASLLVKLGDVELARLAADRAITAATGDPLLVAAAAVPLAQVLRASGQEKLALSTTLAAAYRIAPPDPDQSAPGELSLCGTLLVQAALAAAGQGDDHTASALADEAADLATRVNDGHDHTGFGPTAVELARVVAAIELHDELRAVARHEKAIRRDGWRWLPAEHRAAHLVDAARAYLHTDDPTAAARALIDAYRTAPAEIPHRPTARDVLAQVARHPHAPTTITQLAATLGVT